MNYKDIAIGIGNRFIATFSLLWTFLESLDSFHVLTLPEKRGVEYYLLLSGFCLIVAIVNYILGEFNRKNIKLLKFKRTALGRTFSIKRHLNRFVVEGSYFKLLYLDWRLEVELKKIRSLIGEHIQIEGRKPVDNITYIFRSILMKLQVGDEYITVSCLDFWENVQLHKGFFLTENIEAAKRGVKIKRVIVIDRRWLKRKGFESQFDKLKLFVNGLFDKYEDDPDNFSKMELFFYASDNYEQDASYPAPYAMITNDYYQDYMALLPKLKNFDDTPYIDLFFTQDKNNPHFVSHYKRFEDLYNKRVNKYNLQSLRDLLNK